MSPHPRTPHDPGDCQQICNAAYFSDTVGCFQCIINNTPGVTSNHVSRLQGHLNQIAAACAAAGSDLASASLAAPSSGSADLSRHIFRIA